MSDHIRQTIAEFTDELRKKEQEVRSLKILINQLHGRINEPAPFQDLESAVGPAAKLRGDEFFGKKQVTAARLALERRKALNLGPATLEELFDEMVGGGYRSDAKNEEMAKKSLYNRLTQDSARFCRLPSGKFGLMEWYPGAKKPRTPSIASGDIEDEFPDSATDAAALDNEKSDARKVPGQGKPTSK